MQTYKSKRGRNSTIVAALFDGRARSVPGSLRNGIYHTNITKEYVDRVKDYVPILRVYEGTKLVTAVGKGMYLVLTKGMPPIRATQEQLDAFYEPVETGLIYELKPLNWDVQGPYMAHVKTPIHEYNTRYSTQEKCYITTYYEYVSGESGTYHSNTLGEAIHWVEHEHFYSKMFRWFNLKESA